MTPDRRLEWDWHPGTVPENVALDESAYLETSYSFELFRSRMPDAVRIGRGCSVYLGVMFDLGPAARMVLGDFVLMNGARIICDSEITIGSHSLISWNVVLMDTYRLPTDPARRREVLRQAPQAVGRRAAAEVPALPIRIGANVWIGFDCCVLPGVHIGEGAIVGARSVVMLNVPAYTMVAGNTARVVRTLERPERRSDVSSAAE
jgi:acetyltransferase-like isoleucine patch superfamily enzyme